MLAAENIEVSFGGVRAVAGVSVSVDSGAATAVVGPNGSGKTTLLNAICGLIPASGSVSIDGTPLRTGRPSVVARSGVARTFQTPQVLDEMSCLDNVLLASADRRSSGLISAWFTRPRMLAAERDRWAEASAALSRFGLDDFATAPASRLTYGQRRWLELARVVVARPSYLLADEPSAGLNHAETEQLSEHLRSLRSDGIGVLLVDHKVQFLRDVTERAIVLALGQKVAEDDIEAVWDLAEVQDAYLGNRRVRA